MYVYVVVGVSLCWGAAAGSLKNQQLVRFSVHYLCFVSASPSSIKIIPPNIHSVLTLWTFEEDVSRLGCDV